MDTAFLNIANYFSREDRAQNYLVFQSVLKYSIINNMIMLWKSKGLPNESIKPSMTKTQILL